ncbi:hypothetical protein B0F90DRAFT_1728105 [Multifurca ochricompacta]|uniref:DNA replication regulator Sld3 C-terminal domain-containing protein n=1 Tax=Multifurca ochricompacta TaxID=376703 RepID=A0AAD4QLI9_9AGAM|nr:hypothetical protein B0F90DRAFT_1728105 [Multifurca ochricompacta]
MPLNQFVPLVQLLARDSALSSSDDDIHPLHAGLDEILLTGKWCTYKYQEQLPNIIISRASCTDLEPLIMLFVLERYVLLEEPSKEPGQSYLDLDDKKRWLSEIEKRECTLIPIKPVPVSSHVQKRRRVQRSSEGEEETTPHRIVEERLEGLMDKLVLWQMALPDPEANPDGTKVVHDWTQIFCDDVVQPSFSQQPPEQYKLLRRKLFRIPQWTSSSDDGDSDDSDGQHAQQPQTMTFFTSSHSVDNTTQSRSRSLSVSLEQEAEKRRTEPKTRRVLQREVSMSKVFKGRRKDGPTVTSLVKVESEVAGSSTTSQSHAKGPIILVEGTPQKFFFRVNDRAGQEERAGWLAQDGGHPASH